MANEMEKAIEIIESSNKIVFFGGAGVSTESGIPDFRSVDGLYNQSYRYPPETILSHDFFCENTEEFFRFYRDKMIFPDAKPNVTHVKLAELEKRGKLLAVVTQNIDGLHELAGSKNVFNLHGTVHANRCMNCGKRYGVDAVVKSKGVPHCSCGGIIKPDVVLYGEQLPEDAVEGALCAIEDADCLIVGGTSLSVYPAAGFVHYFGGKHLIVINKERISLSGVAEVSLCCGLGEVFSKLK